jgi:hypothetical protein
MVNYITAFFIAALAFFVPACAATLGWIRFYFERRDRRLAQEEKRMAEDALKKSTAELTR